MYKKSSYSSLRFWALENQIKTVVCGVKVVCCHVSYNDWLQTKPLKTNNLQSSFKLFATLRFLTLFNFFTNFEIFYIFNLKYKQETQMQKWTCFGKMIAFLISLGKECIILYKISHRMQATIQNDESNYQFIYKHKYFLVLFLQKPINCLWYLLA